MRLILLGWNKKLDDDCEYLVEDLDKKRYCRYHPLTGSETWFSKLSSEYNNWEDMGKESIRSLEDLEME